MCRSAKTWRPSVISSVRKRQRREWHMAEDSISGGRLSGVQGHWIVHLDWSNAIQRYDASCNDYWDERRSHLWVDQGFGYYHCGNRSYDNFNDVVFEIRNYNSLLRLYWVPKQLTLAVAHILRGCWQRCDERLSVQIRRPHQHRPCLPTWCLWPHLPLVRSLHQLDGLSNLIKTPTLHQPPQLTYSVSLIFLKIDCPYKCF